MANRYWLPFAVGLFFLFSLLARYWRFRVPGGRHASRLPAHLVTCERDADRLGDWASAAALYELLVVPRTRGRLAHTLDAAARNALDRQLGKLREGLETADYAASQVAAREIASLAAAPLAAIRRGEALGIGLAILAAIIAALALRAAVEPYRVLGGSMLPTLVPDDVIVSNRLAWRSVLNSGGDGGRLPRRGDVVLFRSEAVAMRQPLGPELLVKRAIGLPGDSISMIGDVPAINGWMVPYCGAGKYLYVAPDGTAIRGKVRVEFLNDRAYLTLQSLWTAFDGTYVVKPGEVFVLGDSRSNSVDSRAWNGGHGGGVPLAAITREAQWFLFGRQRSGDVDMSPLLHRIDVFRRPPPVGGAEAQELQDGIAKCLRSPPVQTHPPAPREMLESHGHDGEVTGR